MLSRHARLVSTGAWPPRVCRADRRHAFPNASRASKPFSVKVDRPIEVVSVPCGSNGSINLRINRFTAASSLPPPIIIYLPPGPVFSGPPRVDVSATLAENIAATIVQVDYRLGPAHKYPTPVHDVLFAWDWIISHLVGKQPEHPHGINDYQHARIGVLGELAGGSLANMLALTECHAKGHRVAAAASNDPILDWVFPEMVAQEVAEVPGRRRTARQESELAFWQHMQHDKDMEQLVKARPSICRKPDDWFDPFTSPTLFFRSTGLEVPKDHSAEPLDEFAQLSLLNQQDFLREQMRLSSMNNITEVPDTVEADVEQPKVPRKAARRYPAAASGLALPNFMITTSSSGMLYEQAAEFTHLVQRSMIRSDETKDVDPDLAEMHAQDRALHLYRDPEAVRSWHQGWKDGVVEVAQWFREVL